MHLSKRIALRGASCFGLLLVGLDRCPWNTMRKQFRGILGKIFAEYAPGERFVFLNKRGKNAVYR